MIKNLLREPLVHFLLLGGVVFALWYVYEPEQVESEPKKPEIVISESRIDNLIDIWTKTRQRPPTPQELRGLVEDHLREEIFYREGLALGLDKDDVIIRRRMRQKMELFVEDLASAAPPSEEDLQKFLDNNEDQFRVDRKFTLRQIYINPDRHEDTLKQDIEKLREQLTENSDPAEFGDPFLLPPTYQQIPLSRLDQEFGQGFGQRVAELEPGEWSAPVPSGYGLHLVYVDERTEGRLPPLEEIRSELEREWFARTRSRAKEEFFQKLRARYEIRIELPEAAPSEEQS